MRFSQFCDTAENTEQEQQLFQLVKDDDFKQAEKALAWLTRLPFFGNLFAAIVALGSYESIAEYRKSRHYDHIKDFDFKVDFEKKSLAVGPTEEQKKKALQIVAMIGAAIALIVILRKLCCRCKK